MVAGPDVAAEQTVEALQRELTAALEQQAATAEVLRAINASQGDLIPVFDVTLQKAMRLCEAAFGVFGRFDGKVFEAVTDRGVPTGLMDAVRRIQSPPPKSGLGRLAAGESVVQLADLAATEIYRSGFIGATALVDIAGARTAIFVALRKDDALLGAIVMYRREVRSFTDKQIALLQNFAAQAVIAMENARLLTEQREALEQQTATAEILRVISQSPTDIEPVMAAVAKAAVRFCGAEDAHVFLRDGEEMVSSSHEGPLSSHPLGYRDALDAKVTARAHSVVEACVTHLPDTLAPEAEAAYALIGTNSIQHGFRAQLNAPMLREGQAIGCICLRRCNPGAFTPRQIALLETFAAQAVIAIENVRLFTELRESLEQQTATTDILRVISQSPTDVTPVLDVVAKAARRFCGAEDAVVSLRDGDQLTIAAHEGPIPTPGARRTLDRASTQGRAILDGRTVHLPDLRQLDQAEWGKAMEFSRQLGVQASLAAPMMREETALGSIMLRRREAGPFSPRQIELLETFAAQAVIAIENVRLFTELRESLEYQTATSEVLEAISRSTADLTPVLDTILAAATRLCGVKTGDISMRRDGALRYAASIGTSPEQDAWLRSRTIQPSRTTCAGRVLLERQVVHVVDMSRDPDLVVPSAAQAARSVLAVPLLREGEPIGVITLLRDEVEAFTERQIGLIRTFADQAVIAIENSRLLEAIRSARDAAEAALVQLKAAQANLIQSEKMASLGQLTAGIAHEIKNPLNFVNNFASLSVELLDELKEIAGPALATLDGERRAELDETMALLTGNLDKIAEHGKRADGIVRSMLSHSRGGSGDWQASDINALVDETLSLAYHGARAQDKEFNVTLERDFDKTAKPIEVVPQDVTRVFLNLFGNAFYAANRRRVGIKEAGFRPLITVTTRDRGEMVEVKVRDNGTGIAPEMRDKLFQPFFTTKPTGEGTGLGLSISYDIVTQQHGGAIEVDSEPGRYTEFTVRLPRRRRTNRSEQA